jgi:hypothetical protein
MKKQKTTIKAQVKKTYQGPTVERIALDTDIALVMSSSVPGQPPMMPEAPGGFIQKIFKFGA